jgi:hypothetical protein
MPLPEGFNEFEFLQDLIRRWQNRIVKEEFGDLGGDDFDPDITISRHALRHACTWKDNDTAEMGLMRLYLYYFIHRKAQDLQQPIYGIPTTAFQESFKFKPQISMYFQEPEDDVEVGFGAVTGEISIRIMNEETHTITQSKINQLATRIRDNFARPPFRWRKGKDMASYFDKAKGYQLKILCRDQAEARRIVEQVLDIQGHTPNWKNLNFSQNLEPSQAFPTLPPTEIILGKRCILPRKRPIAEVVFRYAVLHLHGKSNPICLVDRSGIFPNPLVAA